MSLSAEDLGAEVGKLGKVYESVKQEIVDSGITGEFLFSTVNDDETRFKSFVADNLAYQNHCISPCYSAITTNCL